MTDIVELKMRWNNNSILQRIIPDQSAIVVIDTWDRHWCTDLSERIKYKGGALNPVISYLRNKGFTVIWCPAATTLITQEEQIAKLNAEGLPDYDYPQVATPGVNGSFWQGKSYVTCITGESPEVIHKNIHKELKVESSDYLLFTGESLWNVIRYRNLKSLFFCGFAANNCVAGRPYGLMPMKVRGLDTYLIRDLTDLDKTITNPSMTHEDALDQWVASVESDIGPTVLSQELLNKV